MKYTVTGKPESKYFLHFIHKVKIIQFLNKKLVYSEKKLLERNV